MAWLDRLLRRRAAKPAPPPPLGNFAMAGVQDLGLSLDFRRDRSTAVLAALFGAFALSLLAMLWLGSFAKQETMRGYVTAATGSTRIVSIAEGTVAKVYVEQGARVKAGDRLMTVRQQQGGADDGSLTQNEIAALQSQRDNLSRERDRVTALLSADAADRGAFDADAQTLRASLRKQAADLERVSAEQDKVVKRFEAYLRDGHATRDAMTAQQRLAVDYRRELNETRMRLTELSTTQTDRRRTLDRASTDGHASLSDLANRIADVDTKLRQLRASIQLDILAPADGQVATLTVREGSAVAPGQFVAGLADPGAAIRVLLEAPSSAVGLVKTGQRVVLKYDAFPYKTFGVQYGRVVKVGSAPAFLPSLFAASTPAAAATAAAGAASPQSSYVIEVEPERTSIEAYGERRPILIGSSLTADLVVERRRLIDWVLDPILALKGRL